MSDAAAASPGSHPSPRFPIRTLAKRVGERAVVMVGFCSVARWMNPDRIAVVTYHNIVPAGAPPVGDESLHLPVDVLLAQVRELARTHDIVPLDQLWSLSVAKARPRAAITFDDAYAGALNIGIPELAALGYPASVFVSPGFLGAKQFWWDYLAGAPGLLKRARGDAVEELDGDDRRVRERYEPGGGSDFPAYARSGTVEELRAAANLPGVTIGGHGWSHRNLAVLPPEEVRQELSSSLRWLVENVSEAMIPWMTYPYGLSSSQVREAAREVGFQGGFLSGGGGFDRRRGEAHPFSLPRVNVPRGLSIDGFRIRVNAFDLSRRLQGGP